MKKFEQLGRSLTKGEQKKIIGGYMADDGDCTVTYMGCNGTGNGTATCDYRVTCSNGHSRDLCGYVCSEGDGGACL